MDYAVEMKRLPDKRMMDRMIDIGEIEEDMIRETARVIALFHLRGVTDRRISSFGSPEAIEKNTRENFSQTEGYIGRTITRDEYSDVIEYTRDFLREKSPLFLKRMVDGMIRDCHGDIHSEHICFTNDGVVIFDCIEFNERFRYIDVISDIAFLAMDMDFHHRLDLSNLLCEEYQRQSRDEDFFSLLNFYKAYRAYVRGKVEGFELDEPEIPPEEKERVYHRARRFFRLAHEYTSGGPRPLLIAVCGLMGTGKSAISRTLGSRIRAEVLSSDIIRKGLAGIPAKEHHHERFEKGIYSKGFTERTYKEMFSRAETTLKKGNNVILDAIFSKSRQRKDLLDIAKRFYSTPFFIECTSPEEIIRERLEKRSREEGITSDGRWEIYPKQKREYEGLEEITPLNHIIVDTSQPMERTIQLLLERV